jgi:hypothetical protein
MKRTSLLILIFLLTSSRGLAQSNHEIVIPGFDDKYSNYVKQLESGKTDIDYQDFRFSFLESEQFKVAGRGSEAFDDLTKQMYVQMDRSDFAEVIKITKQMLSIDYTSMLAHKILRQTYAAIGDTLNAAKYKTIQFGLMNSIVRKGDGQSCETAWPVIQTSEEYFILQMVGATLRHQSIDNNGGFCDKMEVEEDGEEKVYYFGITKVFEGHKKLLTK